MKFHDPSLTRLAKALRINQTKAEEVFWALVRNRRISGVKFRRQTPVLCFIVDFFCKELSLVIEIDGSVHEQTQRQDTYRTTELKSKGFHVIRYTNDQVLTELPRVKRHLEQVIHHLVQHPSPNSDWERGRG